MVWRGWERLLRKQASHRCLRAGAAVLQGCMGDEGEDESGFTVALGKRFSVSLGSLVFPSQHFGLSLCICSVPSPFSQLTPLTHDFSSLILSTDLCPWPPQPSLCTNFLLYHPLPPTAVFL